ncbi:MAG: ATP-grasp domain-containing protein [Ruminococcus sp.]|nr:ATP-grasp domain-containing protein [Ruminococcus sp.]MBR3899951.1 ATP-grasp domain-containing protein [Ruminococcus sp.]
MKKILLLGGSAQQVVAIETAKRLGYYTILCDFLTDNPGQYSADKFYLLSTTDKEAILKVAMEEGIDGIVAYASDPAAPTAAYVAEKLGLHTNPYISTEILCNKDKFRLFLQENGFNTPVSCGYGDIETALNDTEKYNLPVIIKPVDSSGSKGATVLRNWDNLNEALEFAFSFSRSKRIIIEEYIEKAHPYLIGGDIFIWNGKVIMWGLLNCHRDSAVNSLVPVGKSYPPELSDEALNAVKDTLQAMVDKLDINSGAMNVELVVDKNGKVWPIDVGPRNGGNMIPDLLGYIFGIDVVEMTVKAAMGEIPLLECSEAVPYYATHNLHTDKNGTFKGVWYSEEIKPYIIREAVYKKDGDPVEYFDNAAKAIGIVFFKFDTKENMAKILGRINEHIKIEVQ